MASTHLPYSHMIVPFVMAGAGMALVFAPSANAVLASVRTEQAGQASGANNAIREVGGVFGVAVLASVFTGAGGYTSPQAFVNGLIPALWVGVAVLCSGRADRAGAPIPHAGLPRMPRMRPRQGPRRARARSQPGAGAGCWSGRRCERGARNRGGLSRGNRCRPDDARRRRPACARARRVPAAERREELIAAAVHEFARGGLHGTPVERIARRVGVAQPYVFSLFPTKRELFLAALERGFERVADAFRACRRRLSRGTRPRRSAKTHCTRWGSPTRSCSPPTATT